MIVKNPIIRILRKIKTENGKTALDMLIHHLHEEGYLIKDIANILEISVGTVYKSIKQ